MPSIAIVGGNPGCLSPAGLDKSGWILVSDILAARSNLAKQLSILVTAANPLADMTRAQSWTLDAQGNWTGLANNGGTAQSRTHNSQNQVTQVGAATLSFDLAGNMTTDEQGRSLKYDAWNRLVRVQQGTNVLSQYQYDGLKRRITEQQEAGPQRVLYYSANWQVLEERESGVVQAQQVWSPVYVDALILRDRNADDNNTNGPNGDGLEQRHYVAQDANFNVTALISATTGAVVERYYYQAYGVPTVLDANFVPRATGQSQFAWRYLHQGGRFDWAAGYYHFRNRDLSPTLGRWLNHDPIGFQGSKWNLYEYVEGRPTGRRDPSGLHDDATWPAPNKNPAVPPDHELPPWTQPKGEGPEVQQFWGLYCNFLLPGNNAAADPWWLNWGSEAGFCAAAAAGAGAGVAGAGGIEVTICSSGNVFKVVCRKWKCGWRVDPAHHGKPWGHTHWWRW